MTTAAQQALRRTMENYSSTTRFALACNTSGRRFVTEACVVRDSRFNLNLPLLSDKIIEPVQSRCAILRYSRLSDAQVLKRLQEICAKEKVGCHVEETRLVAERPSTFRWPLRTTAWLPLSLRLRATCDR